MRPALHVLIATFLVGCTTPTRAPIALEPLTVRETIPVSYESVVAPLAAIDADWSEAEDRSEPSGAVIQVDVEVLELDPALATELLGAPAGLGGWVAPRAQALDALQELIDSGRAERVHEARLGVHEHQPAWVSMERQEAYVSSYAVTRSPAALLADPTVDILNEGFRMKAVAELAEDGGAWLDLELTLVELERPIESVEVTIPGSATPVTLQLPVAKQQVLSTGLRLADTDGALLSGLSWSGQNASLLVFLTVRTR